MKKFILILLVVAAGFSGCKKDSTDTFDAEAQAATDDATIQAYIANNHLSMTKDVSGFYYKIVTPGTGKYPTAASTVTVSYVGKLLNGTQFDANDNFSTALTAVVRGWTLGLQHINEGGTIFLIIPSAMGYANVDNGAIPANSVLTFTITLKSVDK
ncbi:FKBP-type peptidyl-prolyl isomerase-like protein [Mucilaginibacter yixingensis]|uniref:Peptidyl-prolyl cis-trans isomerase n=1 Tax=Mucilaginibacter yixingensis TaxID=1295612 RepID=A0A2T5JDV0_9SPHI|nr:FKBP-type peptidyl-prolyl cis-trans isomerase [Mucilaginibacter yixingensis]PTQ99950.1 FKBP-type peptidyl-prolyl isomerase-like protein [Mucilaginibacter yixingensis]